MNVLCFNGPAAGTVADSENLPADYRLETVRLTSSGYANIAMYSPEQMGQAALVRRPDSREG